MDNEEQVKVFWEKAMENYAVAGAAFNNRQFNASASRYYYALYQGFGALFLKRNINIPMKRGSWDKLALRNQAIIELADPKFRTGATLDDAWTLRIIADYKNTRLTESRLMYLSQDIDKLFVILSEQIHRV